MGDGGGRRAWRGLLALGWACGVTQAVLLREGMALAGGSESAWGAVLAIWLLGMSVGARVGAKVGRSAGGDWGPAAMLVAALAAVVLLRAAPALTETLPGEVMATWRAAWVWAAAVFPVAAVGGWSFPTLAAALRGGDTAGRAWALEAAGALAGGAVFTFALTPWGSVAAVCAALGVAMVMAPPGRGCWGAAAGLAVAVGGVLPWADEALAVAGWGWARRPGEIAEWANTSCQRLELGSGPPPAVFGDGALIAAAPDPYTSAPLGHLLALLHPHPRRVACVGCLSTGVVPALLAHPLERLELVEEDPELARLLPHWLGGEVARAVGDPRVVVRIEDPVRLAIGEPVDLILLLEGDPTTLRRHRTRTVEFFRAVAGRLAPGGLVVVRTGVSDTYLAGPGGHLLATVAATLAAVFPRVFGVPGDGVLLLAGSKLSEEAFSWEGLARRWQERGPPLGEFDPTLLVGLMDPHRSTVLATFLGETGAFPSTSRLPRAVLPAVLLAEGRAGVREAWTLAVLERLPRWWAGVAVGMVGVGVMLWALIRGVPAVGLASCVGFASMGWWILLLGSWQAAQGSVYAEVGLLSGVLMAGMAAGAWVAGRWISPRGWLIAALVTGVGLSLLVAGGVALVWPRVAIGPLLLAAGGCTGAAFPGLVELAGGGHVRRGVGRGFAADELGAALGAAVLGTLAFPWLGLGGAGLALAGLLMTALAALLLGKHRPAV